MESWWTNIIYWAVIVASSVASSMIAVHYTLKANYAKPKIAWHEEMLSLLAWLESDMNKIDSRPLEQEEGARALLRYNYDSIKSHTQTVSVYASPECQENLKDVMRALQSVLRMVGSYRGVGQGTFSQVIALDSLRRDIFKSRENLIIGLKGILPNKKASKSHDST